MEYIKQYFEKNNLKYRYDDERNCYFSGFSLPNKLKQTKILIVFKEDVLLFIGKIDLSADQGSIPEVVEYLMRANMNLLIGNFELDYNDGEIRYKIARRIWENTLTEELIDTMMDESINIILAMLMKYGDGLLKVLFGLCNPEEAIESSENAEIKAE